MLFIFKPPMCVQKEKIEKADYRNVGFICHHGARTWPSRSLAARSICHFMLGEASGSFALRKREKKREKKTFASCKKYEREAGQSCRHNFYHYLLLNGAIQ